MCFHHLNSPVLVVMTCFPSAGRGRPSDAAGVRGASIYITWLAACPKACGTKPNPSGPETAGLKACIAAGVAGPAGNDLDQLLELLELRGRT